MNKTFTSINHESEKEAMRSAGGQLSQPSSSSQHVGKPGATGGGGGGAGPVQAAAADATSSSSSSGMKTISDIILG